MQIKIKKTKIYCDQNKLTIGHEFWGSIVENIEVKSEGKWTIVTGEERQFKKCEERSESRKEFDEFEDSEIEEFQPRKFLNPQLIMYRIKYGNGLLKKRKKIRFTLDNASLLIREELNEDS